MLIEGVVNVAPVPNMLPPETTEYQLMVPPVEVADNNTVPVEQRLPGVTEVIIGVILIEAVTAVRVEAQLVVAAST